MSDTQKINIITQHMVTRMADGEGLTPTKTSGRKYDGVLQDATFMGKGICGFIFGATPRFEPGVFVETSEVIKVSQILASGWFVETVNGSRYLISSVCFNPTLPNTTKSVEACAKHMQNFISINSDHFAPLQWSRCCKNFEHVSP